MVSSGARLVAAGEPHDSKGSSLDSRFSSNNRVTPSLSRPYPWPAVLFPLPANGLEEGDDSLEQHSLHLAGRSLLRDGQREC